MLLLALDEADHIATEKHFVLSVPILEELLDRYLALVPEHVHL